MLWVCFLWLPSLLNVLWMITYYQLEDINVFVLLFEKLLYYKYQISGGWRKFFDFLVKITSWACLFRSGLKLIFHWKAQSFIVYYKLTIGCKLHNNYIMPLFKSLAELWMSWSKENGEVSSAKSLTFEDKPSSKLFM